MSIARVVLKLIRKLVPERIRAQPRIVEGKFMDRRLGIRTEGWYSLSPGDMSKMKIPDGNRYQPTTYSALKRIFSHLPLNENDVFVDLGCGKGRTVCYLAAKAKIKKCLGIEIVPHLAEEAKRNAARLGGLTPVEIIVDDVFNVDLSQGTIFFLYDPFGLDTLMAILEKIRLSLLNSPRTVRIVCFNLPYKSVYDSCGWLTLERILSSRIGMWRNR